MPCHFLDTHGPYQLPTGWHEVTTAQYCEIDAAGFRTMEARASYFAGRPIQVNERVAEALGWMLTPPSAPPFAAEALNFSYPFDLGQETYLQVETIRALLASQPLHACFCEVYGHFVTRMRAYRTPEYRQDLALISARNCPNYPITDTYPAVAHCLAELARLNQKYAALSEPDHTEAGRRAAAAGADRLSIFSHLNVARYYAERFSTTLDAVYQWPWGTVAVMLLQDRVTAEINDTLHQQSKTNTNGKG